MGTNGLGIPTGNTRPLIVGDTLPNAPVADAGSSNSDGASDASSSSGGEGGTACESLNEAKEDKSLESKLREILACVIVIQMKRSPSTSRTGSNDDRMSGWPW